MTDIDLTPAFQTLNEIIARFIVLIEAPMKNESMLWAAIPLVISTLFMTLYLGKYKKEELGWNTAFGNTMVFLFVSINLIHEMFVKSGGSWAGIFSQSFYSTITIALTVAAFLLMLITYYHLLPKRVAFFLFSAAPVNVAVYILISIVYAGVPADWMTFGAAILFFIVIFTIVKLIQGLEGMAGKPDGISLEKEETPEEMIIKKLKEKNKKISKARKEIEENDDEKKEKEDSE